MATCEYGRHSGDYLGDEGHPGINVDNKAQKLPEATCTGEASVDYRDRMNPMISYIREFFWRSTQVIRELRGRNRVKDVSLGKGY